MHQREKPNGGGGTDVIRINHTHKLAIKLIGKICSRHRTSVIIIFYNTQVKQSDILHLRKNVSMKNHHQCIK